MSSISMNTSPPKSILRRRPVDASLVAISAVTLIIFIAGAVAVPSSAPGTLFLIPFLIIMMILSTLNLISAARFEVTDTGLFLTDRSWGDTLKRKRPFIFFKEIHSLHLNETSPSSLPFVTLLLKSGRSVGLPKIDIPDILYLEKVLESKGIKVIPEKSPKDEEIEMMHLQDNEGKVR